MKACAAAAGAVIGLALVIVAGLYLVPRLKAGSGSAAVSTGGAPPSSTFSPPSQRIDVPQSDTEKLRQEIDRKRIPFFHMLHDRYADQIEHASVLNDIDTLDVVVKKDDSESVQWLVANAIGPTARDYGFTRVRFYVRNPIGSVEPYHVVAESSWDGSSRWNTFVK